MHNRREFVKSIYEGTLDKFPGVKIFRDDGLRHMIAEMGVGQIVYGTDTPFPWPVNPDTIVNNRLLNNAEKEAILGGT